MNPSRVVLFAALTALAACSQVQPPAADTTFSLVAQTLGTGTEDRGRELAYSSSGALYVAGSTRGSLDFPSKGGKDIFLRRYNPDKTVAWKRQIASSADDVVEDLAADPGGQLYVVGKQGNACFHSKYSPGGILIWKRACALGDAMTVDALGNFYVGFSDDAPGSPDVEIRKYNSSGTQVYAVVLEGSFGLAGGVRDIAVDGSGAAYVHRYEFDDYWAAYIHKLNPNGSVVTQFGDPLETYEDSILKTSTEFSDLEVVGNALYAVGSKEYYEFSFESSNGLVLLDSDVAVSKYTLGGTLAWARTFGTKVRDVGTAVTADAHGNVYAVGVTRGSLVGPNAGNDDVVLRKLNASGATLSTKQFGNASFDVVNDAVATRGRSAELYLTGTTGGALEGGTHRGGLDAFLLRRDGLGDKVWTDQ